MKSEMAEKSSTNVLLLTHKKNPVMYNIQNDLSTH